MIRIILKGKVNRNRRFSVAEMCGSRLGKLEALSRRVNFFHTRYGTNTGHIQIEMLTEVPDKKCQRKEISAYLEFDN